VNTAGTAAAAKKAAPRKTTAAGRPAAKKAAPRKTTAGGRPAAKKATAPAPAAPVLPPDPAVPVEVEDTTHEIGGGTVTQTGAGIVLGIVAYALLVNYLRGGIPRVQEWFRAKFLNEDNSPNDYRIGGMNLGQVPDQQFKKGGSK